MIGLGEIVFANGSSYKGTTFDQNFNGKGRMTFANGDVYQGEYIDGKANGHGILVEAASGVVYIGNWKDDLQHGPGTETWPDDSGSPMKYEGHFLEGKKTGHGKFTFE